MHICGLPSSSINDRCSLQRYDLLTSPDGPMKIQRIKLFSTDHGNLLCVLSLPTRRAPFYWQGQSPNGIDFVWGA